MSTKDTEEEGEPGLTEEEQRELAETIAAVERMKKIAKMDEYSHIRSEREKATFTMMMKMNPVALTNIRKEFFAREDALNLEEFMFCINKHLVNTDGTDKFVMETPEQREFGANMYELFKDIDINGDGDLEWQEFTTFVVEKANLLNKRQKLASLPHYYDSTHSLDASADYRHRNDISKIVNLPAMNQFAMMEDNKRSIFLFNNKLGKHIGTVQTDAAPIAMTPLAQAEKGKNQVVASFSDMTMATYNFESSISTRYHPTSTWATPGVQMCLEYMPANGLLYSGGTDGDVHSWRVSDRKMVSTLSGHTDICMSLAVLKKLNYLASGSLDKTVSIWDSYTNERLLHLHGHKKGILDLTYSPEYRLLVSCGFEHDALVWSPFVKNLVFRLRGHHGALVGVHCVENTPELITADVKGVFKLWDVRKFECVQTFSANLSGTEMEDNSRLCCFSYAKLKSGNSMQKEDDSRIYAASKQVMSFDQNRVVHAATTDKSIVQQLFWVGDSSSFITISDRNVVVWDALIGSKSVFNDDIHDADITAACLDARRRKMVIGDANGRINVYNHLNGQPMKTSSGKRNTSAVISLIYLDDMVRFIAGYSDGLIRVFDENALEDCGVVRTFDMYKMHPELLSLNFDVFTDTLITSGATDGCVRFWNYGSAKCEADVQIAGSKDSVVYVGFLDPLPLIVTSDSLCNVTIWGSRGTTFKGERICGFMNQTPVEAILEPFQPMKDSKDERPPRRTQAIVQSDALLEAQEALLGEYVADEDRYFKEQYDEANKRDADERAKRMIQEAEDHWGKTTSAQTVCWSQEHGLMFTCSDLGILRCFDISNALADITIQKKPVATAMEEGEGDEEETNSAHGSVDTSMKSKVMAMEEDNGYREGEWTPRKYVRGFCRGRARNSVSALPPMPFKQSDKPLHYGVAALGDSASYMGVDFKWAVQAHDDRIVTCLATPDGCLTSGADKLVKMWTMDGLPLGVLMQSVPVGSRSQKWNLILDAENIMADFEGELDEIIETVGEVEHSEDKPDIYNMDFATMEPGANAEDFTRSDLRQRIEQTSSNLGIHFPTEGQAMRVQVSLSLRLKFIFLYAVLLSYPVILLA